MIELDLLTLNWLNDWVARSAAAFSQALTQLDGLPWLFIAAALTGLWFIGEPGAVATRRNRLTRLESRSRVLLLLVALAVTFLLAWLLQTQVFHAPPLAATPLKTPLEPQQWQAIRQGLTAQSSFPSYLTAMLAVVTTGLFSYNIYVGGLSLSFSLYIGALQVGLGLAWPSDVLAGLLLGVLLTSLILQLRLCSRLSPLILACDDHPLLLYPLGFLLLFDLAHQFTGSLSLLALVLSLSGKGVW